MNKLKDFIYDKSDIVVALLIISIAGLIVFSRINAILSYPETFAASIEQPTISEPAVYVGDKDTTTDAAVEGDGAAVEGDGAAVEGDDDIEMLAIYINYGESLQSVAEKFVSVELFSFNIKPYQSTQRYCFLAIFESNKISCWISNN